MQTVSASLSFIPLVGEVKHKSDWTTNFLTEPVAVKGILFGINTWGTPRLCLVAVVIHPGAVNR